MAFCSFIHDSARAQSSHPMTQFVGTSDPASKKHVGDDYFLESGDKIRFFFEPAAFGQDGKLNRPKELAVNKVSARCGLVVQDAVIVN